MRHWTLMAWGLVLLSACSGCNVGLPQYPAGRIDTQQTRAQVYDPYPEPDTGPTMLGVRPPDYTTPRAEILRVQPRYGEPIVGPAGAGTVAPLYQGSQQPTPAGQYPAGVQSPVIAPPPSNNLYVPPPATN